jgi:hypothetical protein
MLHVEGRAVSADEADLSSPSQIKRTGSEKSNE